MDDEDQRTTIEMDMGTPRSSRVPPGKKRGRRSKKTAQPPQQSEEGMEMDEGVQEEKKKPALKRGRPPKKTKLAKNVKKEPASPNPMEEASSSALQEQLNTSDSKPKVVKRRPRGAGGCRKVSKKNGVGETLRAVHLVDKVDIDDIIPDEEIILEELVGFEHIEVFNANLGTYKLDNIQETEMINNMYAMPPLQYNAINFGSRQTVSLQMFAKTEPGSNLMF